MSKYTVRALLAIAAAELGYKEKETNAQLDDKAANAGDGNWTKYARDLQKAGYYQAGKNGYAWCDMFVDWCFLQLCGGDKAKAEDMICQTGLYGAGCEWSAKYYKQQGRFFTSNPVAGDQIFLWNYAHTGIVEKIEGGRVHTIEGNTSNMVARRSYPLGSSDIDGYGRPKYDEDTNVAPDTEVEVETSGDFSVGDIVDFSGTTHYSSANAANGVPCKAGRAKITAICAGAKHPYHCRAVNDAGEFISGVYGWVDAVTVKATTTPATPAPPVVLTGVASTGSDEDFVAFLDALLDMGLTLAGACGVLASIMKESSGKSNNLENRGNTELSMTDQEYTEAVDSGKYTNYAGDRCGYGLFQHTYPTRKAEMQAYFRALCKSISDWMTQIAFAGKEMKEDFPEVWTVVTTTNDPKEASDIFTKVFEAPADTEQAMKDRGELAQEYFKKFSPAAPDATTQPSSNAGGINLPTLRKGDKGDTVKAMQALLIGYGYSCGSSGVDGSFGGNTENALECYQEDNDLTADAVCGPKTWNSLLGL